MFGREQLRAMKKGAILLNIGRGSAVDTDALMEVLQAGHLLGAGLDVTDPEPLPADHPLWNCPNALITPHVTGAGHLAATTESILQIASQNVACIARGERPPRVVDMQLGY